jgi:hypothetical protein
MFPKSNKSKGRQSDAASPSEKLPVGAEAALWSIVEVMPDPRNYLALTRDPTAEVRLTRSAIDAAIALASPPTAEVPAVGSPPARTIEGPAPAIITAGPPAPRASWLPAQLAELPEPAPAMPIARRNTVRWSSDTAEVRLPVFSKSPSSDGRPADRADADAGDGDASVHAIETPTAQPLLPVQRRYARGA